MTKSPQNNGAGIPEVIFEGMSQEAFFEKVGGICAAVNSVFTTQDLLDLSLDEIMRLFGVSRGSIFILDPNGQDLVLRVSRGMQSAESKSMVKRMGEGIVGRVAVLKTPIVVNDILDEQRFGNIKPRGSYKTRSFICSPLMIKDHLIGIINITDKGTEDSFNSNEMQLLDFLSSQIALNYRRIELYQKFKKIIKETQDLKNRLGQSDQEAAHLRKQISIQEKFASIGKLAGGIAHEFNNPLDGVIRYTNLCLNQMKDDDVVRGYLLEIKQGLKRMENIVRNLLACSRNNQLSVEEFVDIKKALDRSLESVKTDISYRNIIVEVDVDRDVPLFRDFGMERILTNLLRNALDSLNDGGKIAVKVNVREDVLNLEVADTGCGIKEGNVDEIFEPFFTTKDIDKGCGLGLTVIGEIVKRYNGKINVESNLTKGTTFFIKLPLEGIVCE
ncbi:ATP-binding protein [Candidatus Omnitrophota bacterium]